MTASSDGGEVVGGSSVSASGLTVSDAGLVVEAWTVSEAVVRGADAVVAATLAVEEVSVAVSDATKVGSFFDPELIFEGMATAVAEAWDTTGMGELAGLLTPGFAILED